MKYDRLRARSRFAALCAALALMIPAYALAMTECYVWDSVTCWHRHPDWYKHCKIGTPPNVQSWTCYGSPVTSPMTGRWTFSFGDGWHGPFAGPSVTCSFFKPICGSAAGDCLLEGTATSFQAVDYPAPGGEGDCPD